MNGNNVIYFERFRVEYIPKDYKDSLTIKLSSRIFTDCDVMIQ